jgi:FkbM family methyltransferase
VTIRPLTRRLKAVWNLALANGPESEVSKTWLLRNAKRQDQHFTNARRYSISREEPYLRISIGNELFLWPADRPASIALILLSELLTEDHPHQYVWGPSQIDKDDVVLDVGACEGSFAALITGRCRRVIAIEPSRMMCDLMRELFRVRGQPCPLIKECLLGDHCSTVYFAENIENPGASRISQGTAVGAYPVPMITLDQLVEELEPKPTFIKCDAEGAAHMIFRGGREFLARYKPKLAIATYHTDREYEQLYDLLKSIGYNVQGKGFLLSGDKFRVMMLHAA